MHTCFICGPGTSCGMEATSTLGGAILRSAALLDHLCRQLRLTAETDVSELIGESALHLKPAAKTNMVAHLATPQHDVFDKLLADACCPTILVVALNKRRLTANHPNGCAGDLRLKKMAAHGSVSRTMFRHLS